MRWLNQKISLGQFPFDTPEARDACVWKGNHSVSTVLVRIEERYPWYLHHYEIGLAIRPDINRRSRIVVDKLPGEGQCLTFNVSSVSDLIEGYARSGVGPLRRIRYIRIRRSGEIAPCR